MCGSRTVLQFPFSMELNFPPCILLSLGLPLSIFLYLHIKAMYLQTEERKIRLFEGIWTLGTKKVWEAYTLSMGKEEHKK